MSISSTRLPAYDTFGVRSTASNKLVVAALLLILTGCAQAQHPSTGEASASRQREGGTTLPVGGATDGCGARAACARTTPRREPTVYPKQVLTGIITDKGEGLYLFRKQPGSWILVEENPNADCGGDQGPLKPGCEKMYFDITRKTDVYQEEGHALAKVPAAGLKKRQKVRTDYTGYDVAESYPSQTAAREVVILGTN